MQSEQEDTELENEDWASGSKMMSKDDMYIIDCVKNPAPYIYEKYNGHYEDTRMKAREFTTIGAALDGNWIGKKQN